MMVNATMRGTEITDHNLLEVAEGSSQSDPSSHCGQHYVCRLGGAMCATLTSPRLQRVQCGDKRVNGPGLLRGSDASVAVSEGYFVNLRGIRRGNCGVWSVYWSHVRVEYFVSRFRTGCHHARVACARTVIAVLRTRKAFKSQFFFFTNVP
jgi:hypothetical protein